MKRMPLIAASGLLITSTVSVAQIAGAEAPAPAFVPCDTLLDARVAAVADHDRQADIDDLIVDRRDGRIVYALIDTNEILGVADKQIALPYGALAWDAAQGRFLLGATASQLEQIEPFDSADLAGLHEEGMMSTFRGIFGDQPELVQAWDRRGADEYTWLFTAREPEKLEGTVIGINREAKTILGAPCYAVIVKDGDARRTVLLAPREYLSAKSLVPDENDEITLSIVTTYGPKGDRIDVARTATVGSKSLTLRDRAGMPMWTAMMYTKLPVYVRASELDDGSLIARGEKFGGVEDMVFEAHSGTAAFAIVGVGGVLGIDETHYPIPCETFMMGPDRDLFTNLPVAKLKLAPSLPSNGAAALNDKQFSKRVLAFFDLEPKTYDTARATRWSARQVAQAPPMSR